MGKILKWSDESIENGIKAVAKDLGHFPSTTELKRLKRHGLSNAICRNGGTLFWSEKVGIKRIHSDSDTGWDGEKAVKAILESKGFLVTKPEGVKAPYDLVVNDRVRIDVKAARMATYDLNSGQPWSAWFYRIGKAVQADIVILYQSDTTKCYILPWFEVGGTNITISPKTPKYSKFENRFDIVQSYLTAINSITY